jgi:hypothetical protein
MPLTYALLEDFIEMKDLKKSGIVVDMSDKGREKIETYLVRATRFVQRYTRRDFLPWRQTRLFAIPYAFHNLSIRRFPSAKLAMDQDLLQVHSISNGSYQLPDDGYYLMELNIKPHHSVALKFPYYWGSGTIMSRFDEGTISIDAIWGYAESSGGYRYPDDFWIDTTFSLTAQLNETATQIAHNDIKFIKDELYEKAFIPGRLLLIDEEMIEVINVDDDVVYIRRAVRGTTRSIHAEDSKVYRWKVLEDITEACLQIAKIWREADLSAGNRIGVSDVSPGAELSIPSDPLRILNSYQRSMLLE